MTRTIAAALLITATAACIVKPPMTYQPAGGGPERELPDVKLEVVSREAAVAAAGEGHRYVVPFDPDTDGETQVGDYLSRADALGADYLSDLAIYQATVRDGAAVECRTEIVPETITESSWRPPHDEVVSVAVPVTHTVTDHEYRCRSTMRSESRAYTEYERDCHSVSRPVIRTRTVSHSSYDASSKSYRQQPRTETYTEHEQEQVCDSRPVTHYRTEMVPDRDCGTEAVTRTVTGYEQQDEHTYVPGRTETLSRNRLRALVPVCYAGPVAAPGSDTHGNRLEGMIHRKRR